LVYRSALAPETSMSEAEGFSEHNFAGKRWRVFRQTPTDLLTVIVAQPLKQRQQLADEVITASIYPVVLSLPLQALLIWLVVSKALSPIKRFSAQLSSKKANDLSPVELDQVPAELDQMLKTTNQLFARLADAFEREKRFASDVAHELRTPLSVLQVNLHNASSQWQRSGISDPEGSMLALQAGVERMSALIEQIMLLNRTNPEHFQARTEQLDLAGLCRQVVADWYPQIDSKQQQIELLGLEHLSLKGDAFALRLLVSNLVGNASKYTQAGGSIQLELSTQLSNEQQQAILVVQDNGPGIAPEEYTRVFDRFYRVGGDRHQSGTIGSGLGLAIVRDIVVLHQGRISLGASDFSNGLKVTVELPL
ncbi:MAG TPA: ATP-binding protein, partial [Rheinheimera sp.]|uniref:ATP-binding protein n=1 Tax=Rheinheimera sp. TaxID=1869214 RepID=UPI002B48464F